MEGVQSAARQPRRSLTKAQLQTALGAELLSLCQTMTKDGRLSADEVADLRTWLAEREAEELPALVHLRSTLARVMEDGRITPDEYEELYREVEAVLPPEARREAVAARRAVTAGEREERRAAKEAERQEQRRNRPIRSANFMVAGVRYEGRPAVIRREVSEGLDVRLTRDVDNQYSPNAIAVLTPQGSQIGFVPEEYAGQLAPLFDGGAKHQARVTKILGRGHVPIPIVQAYLYDPAATVPSPEVLGTRGVAAHPKRDRAHSGNRNRGMFYLAAIAVAAVAAIYLIVT
jgi:hypothetical protein